MKREDLKAVADPGDASAVLRVHLKWCDSVSGVLGSTQGTPGHIWRKPDGTWELVFAVQRSPTRRQRHFVCVDPGAARTDRWPLVKLGPGAWDIPISIHVPDQFHGFVTLVGVPDPAPWEIKLVDRAWEQSMRSTAQMTDTEIEAELESLGAKWDEFQASTDEGHGGSPGEWMWERLGALEHELKRRRKAKKKS